MEIGSYWVASDSLSVFWSSFSVLFFSHLCLLKLVVGRFQSFDGTK